MRMKFSGNYASSSKSVPEFDSRPKKKRSLPKTEGFLSPKSSEDQKKVFTAIWFYVRPEFPLFSLVTLPLTLNGESADISLGGGGGGDDDAEISM